MSAISLGNAELFGMVFNQMQEGVVIRGRAGEILYINPAACAAWGRSEAELRADSASDPMRNCFQEDGACIEADAHPAMRALLEGRPIRDFRMGVCRPNGQLRWLSVNATPVIEPGASRPAYVVVTFQDITDLLETERELQEKTRLLSDISKNLPVMIHGIEVNPDGSRKTVFVSEGVRQIYGTTPEQVLQGRGKILAAIHPEDAPKVIAEVERCGRELGSGGATFRLRGAGGKIRWIHARSQGSRLPDGRIRLNVIHVDVTEQKEIEERLRMFEDIVESSSDLIGCATPDGKSIYVNRAWQARRSARAAEHPQGGAIPDVHPDWAAELIQNTAIPAAIRDGVWRGESAIIDQSGAEIPVSQLLICHKDKQGKPLFFSTIVRDISDLKEMQARLLTASRLTALGEMSAGIAHEINNPLTVIIGYSVHLRHLLSDPKLDSCLDVKMLREFSQKIESTSFRIAQIVKSLRALTRQDGEGEFVRSSVKSVIEDTLSLCRTRLANHKIRLEAAAVPQALEIECRPTEISQTLLNLLNNASDAVAELPEKWIRLELQDLGDQIELAVIDSGQGIPEPVRSKIMQPFFTTKDVGSGTGLGLSISSAFIKRHRGMLKLDTESENTRFVMVLPKSQNAPRQDLV